MAAWNRMTVDQKLNALRDDVLKVFPVVNALTRDVETLNQRLITATAMLSEASREIAKLKRQSPTK